MRNLTLSAGGIDAISCLENYRLSRIERLVINDTRDTHEARDRGTLIHFLLEHYYNALAENPEVDKLSLIDELIYKGNIRCTSLAITDEVRNRVFNTFRQYVQHYAGLDCAPVKTEVAVSKVLIEDEDLDLRVILEGRLDLVARLDNMHIVVDHKSEEKKGYYNKRANQFLLYSWATGLSNVIVNVFGLQKSLTPQDKFRRITLSYFPWNIEEFEEATKVKVLRLVKAIETGYFERNLEQCKWCPYQAICDASKDRRQHVIDTQYKVAARYDLYGD